MKTYRINEITVNGVDLSKYIESAAFTYKPTDAELSEAYGLLKASGPIAFAGVFDDGLASCCVCHERFTPGDEGTAILSEVESGTVHGPVCPACGTALIAPSE